jgi:hypothetical protein
MMSVRSEIEFRRLICLFSCFSVAGRCETIEATIKDIVDDKIKTHVDAHVNPLIETVNKQQQTITEQAQTLSKQAALLYTLLRVLYEANLTITWDFPSFTFPIICDLPMSCKFISSPSLSLHTLRISSSVLTGCLTFKAACRTKI